jgi:hypothetical protein
MGAVITLLTIAGGIMGFIKWWFDYKDRKFAQQTILLGQIICIYAEARKVKVGRQDIVFSEQELRSVLGKDGTRFYTAIALLQKEGRAKHAPLPGYWYIE